MRKIEVKIRQIIWSMCSIFEPHNYDIVLYKGDEYSIKSSLTGYNKWNLYKRGIVGLNTFSNIRGKEFKICHSLKRCLIIFKESMGFQKMSWELIDISHPLGTRLSYINLENIKF